MKKPIGFLTILLLPGIFGGSIIAQSQDDMKVFQAYMTPGPTHDMLAKSTGNWAGTITLWMQPGAQPVNAAGESKNEMILGGRYLKTVSTGNMMGMPFEGMGVTGYDNAKKVFVNTWVDNMGTGITNMEGKWDPQTKSINFSGTMVDPATGKDVPIREVIKFVNDTTQILEWYNTAHGQEYKSMEIRYTRKP
jgi:hypothetical protein